MFAGLPLWRLTTLRRRMFELAGSDRFSHPAPANEQGLLRYVPETGTFVEAGALDGVFESNTYYLERFRGWSGLLVEPSPAMFRRIPVNRPAAKAVQCALVSRTFREPTIELREEHAFSKVVDTRDTGSPNGVVSVPARTLQSVIEESGFTRIDLLSLDVEGFEIEVLNGLDLDRIRPRFILVECLTPAARTAMDAALARHYDFVEKFSERDYFYRAKA